MRAMRNARDGGAFSLPPTAAVAGGSRMGRREVLSIFAGLIGAAAVSPVRAEGGDKKPKKGARGTKEAKGYQLCLSQCLYDCTTPKAAMAKERAECRVECKDECAVSRDQL